MLTKYYDSMLKPSSLFDSLWIFDDLYGSNRLGNDRVDSSYRVNATDECLELSFDLPGTKRSDLSVQVTGHQVDISGKIREKNFKYSYRINKAYDPSTIEAKLEDGVLTLRLERTPESRPRTIDVSIK